jgi:hypothetical protein
VCMCVRVCACMCLCMCVRVLTQKSMHARGKSPERKKRFGILIKVRYISFIGIRTLYDSVSPGYGDHSPVKVKVQSLLNVRKDLAFLSRRREAQ